ncbi:MAG: agarase [Verrucomicrobiae bacterium]|nr:agarase [Verrucomicrobiae bacterium]
MHAAPNTQGFFHLEKSGSRWWLKRPDGQKYFSLGLNHVDPATLRYPENIHIWLEKYGNSMKSWLKESVAPNLKDWGFNCLGWNQEVITRTPTNHRHSRHFTYEEYQWLNMPYCHQLPFADFHQWEFETRNPDFFSDGFRDWCDHVAREHCVPLANDRKLIGYFYIDCPTWLHVWEDNAWKGPLFDQKKLESKAGREELTALATQYYRVTHDAIRRYDTNHLILGDRYEANAPLTMEIIEGARPYVDVLSFQDFKDPVGHLEHWYKESGMPVLWADGAKGIRSPDGKGIFNNGQWYADVLAGLRKNPGCVGAHLCGAYLRNHVRRRGLLDEEEQPDEINISLIRKANLETENWVSQQA